MVDKAPPTPGQFRAARAWSGLTRRHVADAIGASDYSVQSMEGLGSAAKYQPSRGLIGRLHAFYIKHGFVFIGQGGIAKHDLTRSLS